MTSKRGNHERKPEKSVKTEQREQSENPEPVLADDEKSKLFDE